MEILLRILQFSMKIVYLLINPIMQFIWSRRPDGYRIPPIQNNLLLLNLHEIVAKIQRREITSQELVSLYINRIREVNPYINAMVEDRFNNAIDDAVFADRIIADQPLGEIDNLFNTRPLLGVPFTVKESLGVQDMHQVVGSLNRRDEVCERDGQTVAILREAGAIPLLTSASPEFCFSIETFSYTHGRCSNTYSSCRTAGGSSGGEGALNGCGATTFGLGSDIAGSIRIPCMFNGVFGHKPTGGITPISGHFPSSEEALCAKMLQIGPISRYATDLNLILRVIVGNTSQLLKLRETVNLKRIKIHYAFGFTGLNAMLRVPVDSEIENAISMAVRHFQSLGLNTELVNFRGLSDSLEISLSAIARLKEFPYLLSRYRHCKLLEVCVEFLRSLFFRTNYTKEALIFELSRRANGFMSSNKLRLYEEKANILKREIVSMLGPNGVFFFPTFNVPAILHNTSLMALWNIDYTLLFNVMGLPSTHIPMGLNSKGLPIGFQVIAAPFNDRLCLQIAEELDYHFGGWVPPSRNVM